MHQLLISFRGSARRAKPPAFFSVLLALATVLVVALPAAAQNDPVGLPGAETATQVPLMTRPSPTPVPIVAPPEPAAAPAPVADDPPPTPREDVALNLPARISGNT